MIEDCKWGRERASDWCASCDGPVTRPGGGPASRPVTAGTDSKNLPLRRFFLTRFHPWRKRGRRYRDGAVIAPKHLLIVAPDDC